MYHLTPPPDESITPIQLGVSKDPVVSIIDDQPDVATWARRFGAYAMDSFVYFTIIVLLTHFGYNQQGLAGMYIGALIFATYMTVMQVLTHNTIGKYIAGIQVVNEYAPAMIPSLGRIVLRETVGRLLGWMGYLLHIRDPKRQGWNDLMADTIVVRRPVNKSVRRSLIAGVGVFFVAVFVLVARDGVLRQQKAAAELTRTIAVESSEIDQLQRQINQLRFARGSFAEVRQNNQQILALVDRYENAVRQVQSSLAALVNRHLVRPDKVARLQALGPLYSTMLQVAEVEREQADVILSLPGSASPEVVRSRLQPLNVRFMKLQMDLFREQGVIQASLRSGKSK